MTSITITHSFINQVADDPVAAASGQATPSDWNDNHVLTGIGTSAELDFSTDGTLSADSDNKIPTQKAVKTYVDNSVSSGYSPMPQTTLTSTAASTLTNNCYVSNSSSLIDIPLPSVVADGNEFRVIGAGSGGWSITQASGQQIIFGNVQTTSGATGSLSSSNRYDNITLKYSSASSAWMVISSQGNINYA